MKLSRLNLSMLFLSLIFGFSSCDKEHYFGGCGTVSVMVSVEDENGNNLADPDVSGNILDNVILIHNNNNYSPTDFENPSQFMFDPIYTKSLIIDQFHEDERVKNEVYILRWGDGTESIITYSQKYSEKKRQRSYAYTLNGKEVESNEHGGVTIVLSSNK